MGSMSKSVDSIGKSAYRFPRNAILAQVFHRLSIMERFATGVRRIQEAYAGFEQKPSFLVTEHSVTVVLPKVGYHDVHETRRYALDVDKHLLSQLVSSHLLKREDKGPATSPAQLAKPSIRKCCAQNLPTIGWRVQNHELKTTHPTQYNAMNHEHRCRVYL